MIPFDFTYLRPSTLKEAAAAYRTCEQRGQTALYYAGGSEIISMCRVKAIRPDAVIDIKHIPECQALALDPQGLLIGAGLSLNCIKETNLFPLLTLACGRIADHTNQCRITLGGNLCGTIIYRETSLPFLLSEASITLYGPDGSRTLAFDSIFNGRMHLMPGEMVVSLRVPQWALIARHAHIKKTTHEKIDYPLVNVTALFKGGALRVAFSGLSDSPLRSPEVETVLNVRGLSPQIRAENAANMLAGYARADAEGSGEYRLFIVKNTLERLLEDWENDAL